MQPEMLRGPEQIKYLPIRAPEVQREAMWLYAEEETGQKLDRNNPGHKKLMLSLWLEPAEQNVASFYGTYVDTHPREINPNDEDAILAVLHEVKETMH